MPEECCQGHRYHPKKILILVASVVLILLGIYLVTLTRNSLRDYNYIGKSPDMINQITVSGTAKISTTPDVAVLYIGIVSDGPTVDSAQKGVTEKMNAIVNSLKNDFQIEAKDIKTENFSVNPKYDWTSGRQRITGYNVNQSASVKVRNFDNTGDILAKVTALGANNVSGPNFMIDDIEKVKADARVEAIAQAKDKAKLLADQVGIKLGRIVNFYEGGNDIPNFYGRGGELTIDDSIVKSIAPVIEPGSQDVQLTVNISYEIR